MSRSFWPGKRSAGHGTVWPTAKSGSAWPLGTMPPLVLAWRLLAQMAVGGRKWQPERGAGSERGPGRRQRDGRGRRALIRSGAGGHGRPGSAAFPKAIPGPKVIPGLPCGERAGHCVTPSLRPRRCGRRPSRWARSWPSSTRTRCSITSSSANCW